MTMMKRILSFSLVSALLMTALVFAVPMTASAEYDNTFTFTINGTNTTPPSSSHNKLYLYTNTGSSAKVISWSTYDFRNSKLMIFNSAGRVVECGGNITSATSPITGAPQLTVTIPAGGFMIAFGESNATLMKVYNVVMEGAMLYNSTMSVIYEAYASYSGSTLTIKYNNPQPAPAGAKSFLFVGNSTTYFNGTPIKFKAMAKAAGIDVDVVYCTFGSAFLSEFADANHERGKAFRQKLAAKKYDYVVLQDAASRDYYTTKPSVDVLLPLIKANGAEALLYMRYSAASTVAQIRTNAIKHHNNYAGLARDYGLVCAPAADAFVHYAEKYNDPTTLYASDGGHHSKEGSYLIAATWLYSYLGVDPVGNSYTADMSASMVQKLQQCAKIACEEGYAYPGMENGYTEGGVYYDNIAKGKSYTTNGVAYSGDYTDANSDGSPIGKLTDGTVATSGGEAAIGCWKGATVDVVIDLAGFYNIKNLRLDLHGNSGWGIPDPSTITVSGAVSSDGVNFTSIGNATMSDETVSGDWKTREFNLKTGRNDLSARYVKFTFTNTAGTSTFFWSSELRVYGNESNFVSTDSNVALNKSYTTGGIYAPDGVASYPDENDCSLTDGAIAYSSSKYSDIAFVGFNANTDEYKANGYAYITVDLTKSYDLNKFVAYVASTANGNGTAGIAPPTSYSVYVSNDNVNWTEAGSTTFTDSTSVNCIPASISLSTAVSGRYVQFRFVASKNWMMIAEVMAHGTENGDSTVDPEPKPEPATDKIELVADSSVQNSTDGYTGIESLMDGYTGVGEITGYEDYKAKLYAIVSQLATNATYSIKLTYAEAKTFDTLTAYVLDYDNGCVSLPEAITFVVDGNEYSATITPNPNNVTTAVATLDSAITASEITVKVTMIARQYYYNMFTEITATLNNNVEPTPGKVVSPTNKDNLAYGKGYVTSTIHSEDYPDENGASLTDGYIAPNGAKYYDEAFVGFCTASEDYVANGYFSITVDLEKTYTFDKFISYIATGDDSSAGLGLPKNVSVYVSDDNTNWTLAGSTDTTATDEILCLGIEVKANSQVSGRYVQFRYADVATWMMIAEVEVFESNGSSDTVSGDVNGDGKTDSADYLIVKRACFNSYELSSEENARADIDNSGKVDSSDFVIIKRIAFGTYKA